MKTLLAHDDRIELYGLARALADGAIDVVGEAHTAEQVLPLVGRTRPDVLLLSAALAEADGWALVDAVAGRRSPAPAVFVLGLANDPARLAAALEHGAAGCIGVAVDPLDIPALLRQSVAGNFYCVAPKAAEPSHDCLTDRELSVLGGVARGLSNDAIGRELWLSSHTVKSHLHRIYMKLGVSNRTEAARYALEHGLGKPAPAAAAAC